MVIQLDFDLNELHSCGTDEQVSCFIECIANQIRLGAHVFIGEISLFRDLSKDTKLSLSSRAVLSLHSKNLTFLSQYFAFPVKSVITVKEEPWIIKIIEQNTIFNIKYSINNDEIFKSIKDSSIVFENISDEKVYKKIFAYMSSKRNSNERVHYIPIHGGGNDTYKISREEMSKSHNTFCICDSDLKYGNAPLGQTAKQVIDEFSKYNKLHHIHIIKVHEVENLIPVHFYEQLAKDEQRESVKAMLAASLESPEHLFCYDIKDAHKFKKIFSENNDFSNFWKNFYAAPYLKEHVEKASHRFESGEVDARILPKLSGLCNPVKEHFTSEPHNNFSISDRLELEWNDIFERIKNWCAATKPIAL